MPVLFDDKRKECVNLSALINRLPCDKVEVLNNRNLERLDKFIKSLKMKNHWDIVVDYNKFEMGQLYTDDRTGHEDEWGVICTVPATITWVMVASVSLRDSKAMAETTQSVEQNLNSKNQQNPS